MHVGRGYHPGVALAAGRRGERTHDRDRRDGADGRLGRTRAAPGTTPGATGPTPGATGPTPSPAGTTPSPAGTTPSPAGTTPSAASTTPNTSPFPPSAPTGLVATNVRSGAVTLTWTASTPGCCAIEGYDITYFQSFNDVAWKVSVGNVTTTVIAANLRPASQYTFWVSARDGLGHSSRSSSGVTVVTPLSDSGPDTVPPGPPTDLTVTAAPTGGVVLTWSPSTDNVGVVGYDVYQFDRLYVSWLLATVTTTTHTLRSVSSYPLYVRARDAAGNVSIATNVVQPPPSTPTSPSPAPPACRVTYTTTAQWAQGFVADVVIANNGPNPVRDWTLTFTFGGDQRIRSAWNAGFSQSGADVTLRNEHWNGSIAPGASTSIGMLGTSGGGGTPPTAMSLNGIACAVG